MNNPKETHELIRQNEQTVKKSQKHEANLQKNSILYFQIGLIVCLLGAYGLFEMKFETTISTYGNLPDFEEPTYVDIPIIKTVKPTIEEPVTQKQTKSHEFEEVPNDTPDNLFKDEPIEKSSDNINPPIDPGDIDVIPVPEEVPVPIAFVEQVPIYPGCEKKKTNDERRQCMSEKLTKLIQKKFNTGVGDDLGLSGKQVIRTQFKIDKTGHVTDVKVRGTHPELEKEAQRVINKIPDMTPGKQRDKNVGVSYTLPIVFKVQN
ncbi:energy transducer TonB [Hwangdonia seohaensis]|uniref:Energy transducer TonB n=1 Tax=Hwangdonia seohaensis TaxID=1240727 RepID=A0ABW3R9I5_9FLAO|nr:energy transducer TonB [Hwangdonia seohaensis]